MAKMASLAAELEEYPVCEYCNQDTDTCADLDECNGKYTRKI